jgi:hypothetical protein
MGTLKTFAESFGIFAVSIIVLYVVYMLLNAKRATGIGWVHWKGFVLMGVGFLYFVFGLFLTRIGR